MNARFLFTFAFAAFSLCAAPQSSPWIGSWGASPSPQPADAVDMLQNKLLYANQTIREIVHLSAGGNAIRIRLSNAYGREAATIGAVHVALNADKSSIVPGSDHPVLFSGQTAVSIPANAPILSDPITMTVPDNADLAISIYLPKPTAAAGIHYSSQQTVYIGSGDLTSTPSFAETGTMTSWVFLTGVDVAGPENAGTIVTFGDSITDGAKSTVDANHRWPNFLADRLNAASNHPKLGVIDEGIGGNRILHDPASGVAFGVNALSRFDRDVLSQPNVRYIIVLEGINDIGHPAPGSPQDVSAQQIIDGLQQMIERAHERGIKIFGCTLTPFAGTTYPGYYSPDKDQKRKTVNEWIRTSHAFDAVIDFDKAIDDPSNPGHMQSAYDGGDHLHPGDAGYKAMADAINLSLFQ